jgi:hypothetical protein
MGLKEVLEKMKIVEPDESAAPPPPPPAPPRPPVRRPPEMADVLKGAPPRPRMDEQALASSTGTPIPEFEEIYRAAGVKVPAHGFSAEKVLEIFSSAEFASLDMKAKAATLSGFLKMNPSGPVPIADVIQDAVARDQALDGFEDFLRKKLEARRAEIEEQNVALQAEIDEVTRRNQEKMSANEQALAAEQEKLTVWQTRKRIEERRLFDAVAPFAQENPISTGGAGAKS